MTTPRQEWCLDTHRLGRRVLVFDRLDSTNSLASSLAHDPAANGLAILADVQTAGRGQHGRTWLAAPGQSVLLSLIVSPPPELCRPAVLTAWAAVAVCSTIQQTIGESSRIKWPNDVFLRERKVCGILIESAFRSLDSRGESRKAMIVGIGLNVQQGAETFAAAGLPEATSLAQWTPLPLDTQTVAADLIRQLDTDYDLLLRGDLFPLESDWKARLGLLGKHVVAECADAAHHGRLLALSFDTVEISRPNQNSLILPPERIQHLREAIELEQS